MTDKEILRKAVNIAEKNGYNDHMKYFPTIFKKINADNIDDLINKILWSHCVRIIFSHEFAKAFWGKDLVSEIGHPTSDLDVDSQPNWIYHIQKMVTDENKMEYLEKFLKQEKE